MEIYVSKDNQRFGPYTEAEVRERMASGRFSESDFGWHEGLTSWLPLSQVLASLPVGFDAIPPVPRRSSGLAKASFIIAMVGIGLWLVLLVIAAAAYSAGASDADPVMVLVGLLIFAGMAANLAGCVMGIVALTKNVSNRWMAVTGAIVNAVEVLGIIGLMIIGSSNILNYGTSL